MTIATAINRSGPYTGNGVTSVFAYDFKIEDRDHVQVVRATALNVETVLAIDTDYTVTGVGDDGGGDIILNAPLAAGLTLTMILDVPFTQETDLENQGAYFAETVEAAFDLSAQRDLQLSERLNRAILLPVSSSVSGGALAAQLAADITRLGQSADEIDIVAGIDTEVVTVAGIADDVALLADVSGVLAGTASAVRMDEMIGVGDGVKTAWTLPRAPGVDENVLWWVGGAIQDTTDYSVSGVTLTHSPAVANGVEVRALVMTLVTANDIEKMRDDAEAARDQALAVAGALPAVAANRMLVDNAAGTARETKSFADVRDILYELAGFSADGATDDQAKFSALGNTLAGRVVDLRGKTYRVSTIPTNALFVNGFWSGPFENWEDTNDLTQPHWGKSLVTIGGTNVVIPTAVSGAHYLAHPSIAVLESFPLFVRIRAKASGYNIARLRLANAATGAFIAEAVFNLATGVISGSAESLGAADGSGYRSGVAKFTIPAGMTLASIRSYVYDTADGANFAGDGVKGVEITDMKFGAYPIPAMQNSGMISSARDTGGVGLAYAGGVYGNDSYSGRSNDNLFVTVGSQGSRAAGPSRAGVYSSIYSAAFGNVSAVIAGRHSYVAVPQAVIIGSEECAVRGPFRGTIAASINSVSTGESNIIAACRATFVSSRNGGAISSAGAYVGRGGGWKPLAQFLGGAITGVTTDRDLYGVLQLGTRYRVNQTIKFVDRMTGAADATGRITSVNAEGGVTGAVIDVPGTNYGTTPAPDGKFYVDAYVDDDSGDFSLILASSAYAEVTGLGSAIIASSGQSANFARVGGDGSAVLASTDSQVDANQGAVIASVGSSIPATSGVSAVIAGNNSQVTAAEAVVFGRRTINPTTRELAGGDNAAGVALSSNRKWSISNATGVIKSVTTFSASGTFADFGEYFENRDEGVIPFGTIVMLDGDKITAWDGEGAVLGVISATVAFMGNDADFEWQGRWLKGDFGEAIVDSEGLPIENPDYDPAKEMLARSARPDQWSPVGLLGQVFTRVSSSARPGDVIGGKLRVMSITKKYSARTGYAVAKCFIG